jgi:hypothetical protein
MKTSNVTLEISTTKKKATFHVFIERTSEEIYNMGNSSFLINLSKKIFTNGKLIFAAVKYSTKGYEVIEFKQFPFNCFGLQIRCNNLGKDVSEKKKKIATVVYDYKNDISSVGWRLIDSAVVTPNFETVETKFILNFK